MTEPTKDASQTLSTSCQWEQVGLQLESPTPASAIDSPPAGYPFHAVKETLLTAGQARDALAQRDVLARLYTHLAQQAIARGRRPVPKAPVATRVPRGDHG